jgi:hypothetical protein
MAAQSSATGLEVVEGWKGIAAALAVDEKTARRYAAREVDPLPTRVDHRGIVYIHKAALVAWVQRHDRSTQDVTELERLRTLVEHLRTSRRLPELPPSDRTAIDKPAKRRA